jgi:hypothetical protein
MQNPMITNLSVKRFCPDPPNNNFLESGCIEVVADFSGANKGLTINRIFILSYCSN